MVKKFITFEGGEGVGKSTQIRRLAQRLEARGEKVLLTREPGGSPGAEAIRHVLLSGGAKAMGSDAEVILFAAARADHVEHTIRPALDKDAWVLCDRFIDSTRVYQGLSGVEPELIGQLEFVATEGLLPELTIILDLPATRSMQRIDKRREAAGESELDRFEREPLAVHRRRRSAFLSIAKAEPDRCVVVSASPELDEVEERVWEAVAARFDLEVDEHKSDHPDEVVGAETPA